MLKLAFDEYFHETLSIFKTFYHLKRSINIWLSEILESCQSQLHVTRKIEVPKNLSSLVMLIKYLKNELKSVITALVGFKRRPQSKQAVGPRSFLEE